MAKRYTSEEACEIIVNDDFSDIDSKDSLDSEIESDSSSTASYLEVDSDPENDFPGKKVLIQKHTTTRGRQLNRGRRNVTTASSGRARTLSGRVIQSLSRGPRCQGRGPRTRRGTIHRHAAPSEQIDNRNSNTPDFPEMSDDEQVTNLEEHNATSEEEEEEEERNKWTENKLSVQNFVFNEKSGMNTDVPDNASPMYFFHLLLTEKFIQDLVTKTNEYAEITINSSCPLRRRSNMAAWKDVTGGEMRKFIGIVSAMGLVSLPSYKKYWSRDPVYKNHFFRNVISRERFELIMRFFLFW